MGLINHTIQAQASVQAFNDGFLLLGVSFLVAAPAILAAARAEARRSAARRALTIKIQGSAGRLRRSATRGEYVLSGSRRIRHAPKRVPSVLFRLLREW